MIDYARKSGTYEATLEILESDMKIEMKYTENQEFKDYLQKKIDYIDRQLKKTGARQE